MTKPVAWQKRYRTIPCESNGWAEWSEWNPCTETAHRCIQSGLMPDKQSRALIPTPADAQRAALGELAPEGQARGEYAPTPTEGEGRDSPPCMKMEDA